MIPRSDAATSVRPGRARAHWPEYLCEALGLALFMVAALGFAALLGHPASPLHRWIAQPVERRMLMGATMGLTAIGLIYSPWGRRSGAHLNPAVTLAFARLGRVAPRDVPGYILLQFAGATLGAVLATRVLGPRLADPGVHYATTAPGPAGTAIAFAAELLISLGLMTVVLRAMGSPRWAPWTGVLAGVTVALWIGIEAPLSGMSMNPARTFASDWVAQQWRAWWVYFVAPPLGMLAAAELHRASGHDRTPAVVSDPHLRCAKLHHPRTGRCLFCEHHTKGGRV